MEIKEIIKLAEDIVNNPSVPQELILILNKIFTPSNLADVKTFVRERIKDKPAKIEEYELKLTTPADKKVVTPNIEAIVEKFGSGILDELTKKVLDPDKVEAFAMAHVDSTNYDQYFTTTIEKPTPAIRITKK